MNTNLRISRSSKSTEGARTANSEIVSDVFAALSKGKLDAAAAHFDASLRIYEPAGLPYGGVYVGHEGFYTLFNKLAATYDELSIPPSVVADCGPAVVAMTTLCGIAKRTRTRVEMPLNEIFVLRNGKITEIRPYYWDTAAVVAALNGADTRGSVVNGAWAQVLLPASPAIARYGFPSDPRYFPPC
jgi:uncharacterized protein